MAALNFDATQVEPDAGFDVIPAGWYNAKMDESELKPTKDGLGTYLKCRFAVIDGQYANRKIYTNLNIKNANATAQEIALKQLSAIGHAVGVLQIANSEQLHGIPLKLKLKIRKGDENYEDQNEIISYKNINEPVETVGGGAATATAAKAPVVPAGFGTAPAGFAATAPAAAPAAPAAPAAFAPPAAPVAHDPIAAALADGWALHPSNAEYHWKGADVVKTTDLVQHYPAPAPAAPLAPAAPAAPATPSAPVVASTDTPWAGAPAAALAADNPFGGATPAQPWAGGAAPAAAAPAAPAADPAAAAAAAAQGAAPPWAAPAA